MKTPRFAAIILAAGLSSRMKEFKPLLKLGETTLTDHAIAIFKNVNVDVILVVGYRREDIVTGIKEKDITIVYNPDYKKDMLTSVRAGIRQLPPEYDAFFVLPVDVPLVEPATIQRLMEVAQDNPDKIICPTYHGKRGHPPLLPKNLIPAILEWKGNGGLRAALNAYESLVLEVAVDDEFILKDIDTPEDYQKLLK